MTETPQTPGTETVRRRWLILAVVALGIALIAIVGLVVVWLFFFGSEAPAAPTIDDAIKVLLPTATPE
jgi:hypothetical protein